MKLQKIIILLTILLLRLVNLASAHEKKWPKKIKTNMGRRENLLLNKLV